MLTVVDDKITQIRASGLGDLLTIVVNQFRQHCFIVHRAYEQHGKLPPFDVIQKEYPELKSVTIIAQTFTASVIEAFYFDYYHGKVSRGKAQSWAKQSPPKQFLQLSEKFLSVTNSEDLLLYKDLINLNKLRLRWVHNESTALGGYSKDLDYINADNCVQLLRELFEHFCLHDPECLVAKLSFEALTELQVNTKGFSGRNAS